jgi:curved DNA-binding protein CbpA
MVTIMAAADPGGPGPDLYQLLGVPRGASREEIAREWRRRARAEHPDSQPGDAAAPGRFRALAGAWQVLGDPARRAAYDRALGHDQPAPAAAAPAARAQRPAWRPSMMAAPGPPLRAGPVRVSGCYGPRPAGGRDEEEVRLAILAALALGYLARDRDWPW